MYRPEMLTIMTTDKCTAACDHCSVSSDRFRRDRLSVEQITTAIQQTHDIGGLQTVVLAGGEPTLLKEDLNEAIAYAYSLGLNTRVVTNASWAVNEKKAKAKITELRSAGLIEINFSLDTYHEPYIPVQNIRNAWAACKGAGFQSVVIATHSSNDTSCSIERIREILGEDVPVVAMSDRTAPSTLGRGEDGTLYCISVGPLQKIGRASAKIEDPVFDWHDLDKLEVGCRFFANNPALSPRNTLTACCGVETNRNPCLDFGVLGEENSVSDVLDGVSKNLFLSAFSMIGPVGMARALRKADPDAGILDRYTSVCHVCEHVTQDPEIRAKLMGMSGKLAQACVAPEEFM